MSQKLSEVHIIRTVAELACKRISRQVIAKLQKMDDLLSGEGSGLKNTWDEICVQIQYGYSCEWDLYEETVHDLIEMFIEEIPSYEREAIWLQTDQGKDWDFEDSNDREPYPVCEEDIIDYIQNDHVYSHAMRWRNNRIRRYLDRSEFDDY